MTTTIAQPRIENECPDLAEHPCPRWCDRRAGHGLAAGDRDPITGDWRRIHISARERVAGSDVEVDQFETIRTDGSLVRSPRRVCIVDEDDVTPDED